MGLRDYLSTVLDGMAKGLFASLIIGVIVKQLGTYAGSVALSAVGQTAQYLMGPCIGVGVAVALGCRQYTTLSAAAAGAMGAGCVRFVEGVASIGIGEPVGALIASWLAIEAGKRLEGRTKFDLLLVPGLMLLVSGLAGMTLSPFIALFLKHLGGAINELTTLHPLPMGMFLAVSVGMILTLPISSAALCIAVGIDGLAAGAALAGCCAQMVGFAVISFRDNSYGGLLALGLGTSMLQVPNIIKNPWIWIPPTLASAVCGPLSTLVFKMETTSVGAGMGTSGLVGQLTTLSVMGPRSLVPMLVLHFLLPAATSLAVCAYLRGIRKINSSDLKL